MRTNKKLVVAGMFLFSVTLLPPSVVAAPVGDPVTYKEVDGRELKIHVLKPDGWTASDKRPAIVLFHGGGWTGGKPELLNPQARHFTDRGMVSLLVEYRLLKGKKELPVSCIQDARSAMRWVRGHAGALGVDPERIAAGGGSAGGHLAAFVGMVEGFDDPQDDLKVSPKANAMILFNPVSDNGPGKWGHGRVGARYREISPAHHITAAAPPAIVLIGTEDHLISVATAKEFQAGMEKAGVPCETVFYQGQGHGFFNKEPWLSKTLAEADRFLSALGWLDAAVTPARGNNR